MVEYPPPNISVQRHPEVQAYAEKLLNQVIEALTVEAPAKKVAAAAVEPGPREIVFKGTLDEVNQFFYDNLWTDGLPIIPPTIKKVEEFLKYTNRPPDEVIGVLPPGKREATIWKIAVNGVMAGCRPEYMPVLIAVAEAITDPRYGIEHAGSTSGWAPWIIINGPIIKQLDFNYAAGVTRPGRQANTAISRFLRLFMINLPRYLVGVTDKATFGQNYFIVLAEAEDENPWKPLSVDLGFKPGANIVTVTSAEAISDAFTLSGTAIDVLRIIAWQVTRELGAVPVIMRFGPERSIVLALTPLVANLINKSGYSKSDIKQYLFEVVKMRASEFDMLIAPDSVCGYVKQGRLGKQFCESTDPNRMLPLVHSPNDFLIVVSGDPTRNRAFVTLQGGNQGLATSKEIKLPANWDKLMKELKK